MTISIRARGLWAAALLLAFSTVAPVQALPQPDALSAPATAHGGGCRKSSPAGQCCHMDNSAGSVHCH